MNSAEIASALRDNAVPVVFVNALLQQLGLPVPAFPTLLIAGSLAASQGQLAQVIAAAAVASLAADALWYGAGRVYGYRVLIRLCKLSLNPDSCVTSTESLFMRWGAWSLIVAKLVPGLSTVGPPVAGSLRLSFAGFLAASAIGAGLWAGGGILAGWFWRSEVESVVAELVQDGKLAAILAAVCVTLWVTWAVWRRNRLRLSSAIPAMEPSELAEAMASNAAPLLLDLRGPALKAATAPIDGVLPVQLSDLQCAVGHWSKHASIVAMCACPADDIAKAAALRLIRLGHKAVFVLRGGYESWLCYTAESSVSGGELNASQRTTPRDQIVGVARDPIQTPQDLAAEVINPPTVQSAETSFSPITPDKMRTIDSSLSGEADSPNATIPKMAVPAAPIPVQTA